MKQAFISAVTISLFLAGCGQSSVGRPCTSDQECDFGQSCLTQLPGGYCTKSCSIDGDTRECPGGTVCANHGTALLCSATCQQQSDCRAEYECNGVSNSSLKACRPKK